MTFRRGLQIALTAVLMALILPGCKRNQTPDIPAAPDGPGQGFINTVYGFSAIGQDPDGDSVALQFDWGDGNQTAWSGFVPNGSAVTSSKAYSTYHTYQVKARAKDQHEAVSDWSAAHQIAIGNSPPLTPKIIAGPDTVWFTNSAAFLATGTDPDRDPLRFQFAWGDGDTSDWLQPTGGETACSASHSWQAPGLFRLKARTKDTSGAVSPWSQAFGLTVLGLAEKWRFANDSEGIAAVTTPVILADLSVVYADAAGIVYYLSDAGHAAWKYALHSAPGSSPSLAASGTIYILCADGNLNALSIYGDSLWSYPVGGQLPPYDRDYDAPPSVGPDGTVFVPGANLYAISPFGVLVWRMGRDYTRGCSPAIAVDGTVYVRFGDSLCALNPADTTIRWSVHVPAGPGRASAPSVGSDGTIYCSGSDGFLYAIQPNGALRWSCMTGGVFEPVLGLDGTVYVVGYDSLLAVGADGHEKWSVPQSTADEFWSAPVVVAGDSAIYAVTAGPFGGNLYALNPKGSFRWELGSEVTDGNSPCLSATGRVYLATLEGLTALSGSSPLATSAWPCPRHDNRHSSWAGWMLRR